MRFMFSLCVQGGRILLEINSVLIIELNKINRKAFAKSLKHFTTPFYHSHFIQAVFIVFVWFLFLDFFFVAQ